MTKTKQPQWIDMYIDGLGDCIVLKEKYIDMWRWTIRTQGVRVIGDADYDEHKAFDDAVLKMKKKLHLIAPQPLTRKNEKSFKKN